MKAVDFRVQELCESSLILFRNKLYGFYVHEAPWEKKKESISDLRNFVEVDVAVLGSSP